GLEGTAGWRCVVEEIERAGDRAHLADPAETAARRGRKRRAKTDNVDCDLQLRLLLAGGAAGVVDPTGEYARAADAGASTQDADRPAHRLAAAHPRAAVPPGGAGRTEAAHARWPGGAAAGRAFPSRTRARRPGSAHARQLRS